MGWLINKTKEIKKLRERERERERVCVVYLMLASLVHGSGSRRIYETKL